jgi:hypothetical protein
MHYTSHSYGEVRAQCLHPLAHLGFHVSSEETAVGVVWLVISGGMLGKEDYHVFEQTKIALASLRCPIVVE